MAGQHPSLVWLVAAAFLFPLPSAAVEADDWSDYQVIMWQKQSAEGYHLLRTIGFTAAMLRCDRDHPRQLIDTDLRPLIDSGMRYYVENIATDFYSAYHLFSPGRPPNWRFLAAKKLYLASPDDPAALVRDPSLSDPDWMEKIARRVEDTIETNRPHNPLFYNLADEPGIADLNAFWDFDFSKPSLAAMRQWLMSQYANVAALNAEWGAHFATWDEVKPMITPDAMRRRDGNLAGWADFKAWMDVAFARAFAAGRDAVHAADPAALAGMEGGQKPGWGGYNYVTLAGALDVMETEPGLFPLVHALSPRLRLLVTSFRGGPLEEHRLWRALLDGGSGVIVWDAKRQFLELDGSLGERGRTMAPYLEELRSGIGALIINAAAVADEAAILYSPESFRVQWLLDWKDKGNAWLSRGAGAEDRDDNTVRNAIDAYARTLGQLGFAPTYLSPAMIEAGALRQHIRILFLPHAIALSKAATRGIAEFAAGGGTVVADTMPGAYDEHGKKLSIPRLAQLFNDGSGIKLAAGGLRRDKNSDPPLRTDSDDLERLSAVLAERKIKPAVRVTNQENGDVSDVQLRTFRDGAVTLLALLRDAPAMEVEHVAIHLPDSGYVYDVRRGILVGRESVARITLDTLGPVILAVSPHPLSAPTLIVSSSANRGDSLDLRLGIARVDDAEMHVLHVAVSDTKGQSWITAPTNVVLRGREAQLSVPVPHYAAAGKWTIEVVDVLSGQKAQATVTFPGP